MIINNIEYEINKGKRKNIYLQIKNGKVIVKVPYYVKNKQIEEIVYKKSNWIQKSLEKYNQKNNELKKYQEGEIYKIYKVKEHKKPAGLKGEFIAYYNFQKKETTYYDKNEIPTKKFQKTMNYEPQKPDEKKIQRHKVKSVNTPAKLLNTNFTSDVNTTGTSLYSYLPDNRIKVSSSQINSFPYYSICKLTMTFPDSPGYVTLGTGYELWNKLCATAGHCLLNSNGKYFNSIDDCVIDSNNYCMPGQSGSPLYLPGGYAIGITSGNANDRSMFSVQLDNGITTWLNQNGYFD